MVRIVEGPSLLKRLRAQQNYSQEHVAREIGVTLGAVSQWERGITNPRREKVEALDEMLTAGGALLRAFGYVESISSPGAGDVADRVESLTRLNRAIGAAVDALLQGAIEDGREDLVELRAELDSALRAVQ